MLAYVTQHFCCLLSAAGACLSKALADAESELSQHHLTRQRQVEAAQEVWGREVAEAEAAWERRVAGACRDAKKKRGYMMCSSGCDSNYSGW
jgi:hypothetical protein